MKMPATTVTQDSLDFSLIDDEEFPEMVFQNLGIDFDVIASEATDIDSLPDSQVTAPFDNTKLTEVDGNDQLFDPSKLILNNGETINLPSPPSATLVQVSNPDLFPDFQGLDFNPLSPEIILLQPVSPEVSDPVSTPMSIDLDMPMSFLTQPAAAPGQQQQQYTLITLPSQLPEEPAKSPCTVQLQEKSVPSQLLVAPAQSAFQLQEEAVVVQAAPSPLPAQNAAEAMVLPVPSPDTAAAASPRKRGRKPKNPDGTTSRGQREKKQKVYQMEPLSDTVLEKKRKNAVNAKLHRDKQKHERENLAIKLTEVTKERDQLLKKIEQYKFREEQLRLQLSGQDHQGMPVH